MSLIEAYLFLFFDSIMGRLILPPHHSYVYSTMLEFGGYEISLIWIISIIGATIGLSANYLLGKILRSIPQNEQTPNSRTSVLAKQFRDKYYYLLLLSFIPAFGEVLTVGAGLALLDFKKFAKLTLASNMLFYSYQILF